MFNRKQEYELLNQMLDEAISGEFGATVYDERELSKLQAKLERYLRLSDISARKVQEEKESLKELVTNISHQTKTPLTNILLYAQLLEEAADSAEERQYAGEIMLHAQKLETLVGFLVKMSRLEIGVFQFEPQAQPLQKLAESAVDMVRGRAAEKNIAIRMERAAGEETDAACVAAVYDLKWTAEAMANILDNAVKYSGESSVIRIECFAYEMFAGIRIGDEGIGILEDELPRIFGRFYRGKNVRDEEGIGVGLYLAREIVEGQGGYIKVTSESGKGAAFALCLPRA